MKFRGFLIPEIVALYIDDLDDKELSDLVRAGNRYVRSGTKTDFRKGTLLGILWDELSSSIDLMNTTLENVQMEETQRAKRETEAQKAIAAIEATKKAKDMPDRVALSAAMSQIIAAKTLIMKALPKDEADSYLLNGGKASWNSKHLWKAAKHLEAGMSEIEYGWD